ncbi:ChrR family anti-sigma-E factor [Colwellia sp. E2M01]|uniref:ChrR family anti-sigma-E factor n=1 Tax=Colwellia sp. E2M01 TaxID=2841561 RepID=UPI001C0909D5|nr:ChrR family anti-sigma-E factor [Colwellia sp. E2M01]MBU2872113.1 ChrR family anti-sigma-E factor [Colwellia sp. E2M01]
MITHHPKFELIQLFVNGQLPASLSAAIAIHADMCPKCQQQIALLTEQMAEVSFEEDSLQADLEQSLTTDNDSTADYSTDLTDEETLESLSIDDMVDAITMSDELAQTTVAADKTIIYQNENYVLPKTLSSMTLGKKATIGKLSRTRIQLNENEVRTSLLQIAPGGGVPEHTHKGFELTLLLEGSFHDEKGEYVKGDFIMLDSSVQHHPISKDGCLCYTVANDALHFTQGINKLLNPIGGLIY